MTHLEPAAPRHTVRETGEGLSLCMPSRPSVVASCFLPLWLCGWAFGEIFGCRTLFGVAAPGHPAEPSLFLLVWLLGWTAAGVFAIYTLLWQAAGREIVSVSAATLTIRREIRGLAGRTWAYDLARVQRLRLAPLYTSQRRGGGQTCQGTLAFDYGATTVRFGAEVDEAEAAMILQRLVEAGPTLRHDGSSI